MRLLVLLLAACSTSAAAPDSEREAVEAAVGLYFRGHATGDGAYFRRAFHPDAYLYWVADGKLGKKSLEEFASGADGKPANDESQRKRRILSIDITDDMAIAKVELDYPGLHFVDYLSLLKLDGRWLIVNKIFHRGGAAKVPSRR